VTTTGSCVQVNRKHYTSPDEVLSFVGTNNQTRCINIAISTITFAVSGGGTGATVTGLPDNRYLIAVHLNKRYTTASGSFPYTITTTELCPKKQPRNHYCYPNAAITLTSGAGTNDQTKCINVAITTSHLQLAVEELEQP
jgi:hypothetical protein